MPEAYVPIFLFILVAIGFAIFTLMVSKLVHASRVNKVKLEPYECGIEPLTDARDRYSVRYYLVAMLFVIFDVETVFMFPWAVIMDELALFGLIEMLVFPVHPGHRVRVRMAQGRPRLGLSVGVPLGRTQVARR